MIVVPQLGTHGGERRLNFQYHRTSCGVHIREYEEGVLVVVPGPVFLANAEWSAILRAIEDATGDVFRLIGRGPVRNSPNESLYRLIKRAVRRPADIWRWDASRQAVVCAILEHEGNIRVLEGDRAGDAAGIVVGR